jgi:hypothetical protein
MTFQTGICPEKYTGKSRNWASGVAISLTCAKPQAQKMPIHKTTPFKEYNDRSLDLAILFTE